MGKKKVPFFVPRTPQWFGPGTEDEDPTHTYEDEERVADEVLGGIDPCEEETLEFPTEEDVEMATRFTKV